MSVDAFVTPAPALRRHYVQLREHRRTSMRRAVHKQLSVNMGSTSDSCTDSPAVDFEKTLLNVRAERKRLEKAADHLRNVEKELSRAAALLSGSDVDEKSSSSSSSSSSEDDAVEKQLSKKRERERMKKQEKRGNDRIAVDPVSASFLKAVVEVDVCRGKHCSRQDSATTLSALQSLENTEPRLRVGECSCLGQCKDLHPTVKINGELVKQDIPTLSATIHDRLDALPSATSNDQGVAEQIVAEVGPAPEQLQGQQVRPMPVIITGEVPAEDIVSKLFAGVL